MVKFLKSLGSGVSKEIRLNIADQVKDTLSSDKN
jgi:hypothetical protein